jgi:drug/metabolite transporter (DMT)-like permease
MNRKKIVGFLAGGMAAIIMASLGLFVRRISLDAEIITFARLSIGLLFVIIYLFFSQQIPCLLHTKVSSFLILSGICLGASISAYIKAIHNTSLVNAVFLLYLAPILAIIVAAIWLDEKLKPSNLLLFILSFLGFVFILEFQLSFDRQDYLGSFWGAMSAILYTLFIIFNRKISAQIPALIRSAHQLFWGMMIVLPPILLTKAIPTYPELYWLTTIGFLHGYLALTLMIVSLQNLEVYEYDTISYLEPVVATLLGIFVVYESVSFGQLIGCLMILIAGIEQVFLSRNNSK